MRQFKKVLTSGVSGSGESYLVDYIVQNYHKVNVRGISKWHGTSVKKNLSDSINKIISKQDPKAVWTYGCIISNSVYYKIYQINQLETKI